MSEGGVLDSQCRPGAHAVRPSGRRFRRLAALAGLLTLASGLLAAAAPAAWAATGAAAPSPAPWAAAIVAGALCAGAAAYWLRRARHQARHAR
jgi:hypothetical protein